MYVMYRATPLLVLQLANNSFDRIDISIHNVMNEDPHVLGRSIGSEEHSCFVFCKSSDVERGASGGKEK